ncbi:MAG: hypothetical protein IH820_10495 [Bacteroidetes bacterium]|nr:hypothetical protein [Bacteroidota bacterium]
MKSLPRIGPGADERSGLLDRINEGTHWLWLPAASTITTIRKRHGLISQAASEAATPYRRFERAAPNELWQMQGYFRLLNGQACHPLTVLATRAWPFRRVRTRPLKPSRGA